MEDVAKRYKVDGSYVVAFGWSSGGPACYALSLQEPRLVTGAFAAMSVFKPEGLPRLANAKGQAYAILHSSQGDVRSLRPTPTWRAVPWCETTSCSLGSWQPL